VTARLQIIIGQFKSIKYYNAAQKNSTKLFIESEQMQKMAQNAIKIVF
jgi:hypothetical protein